MFFHFGDFLPRKTQNSIDYGRENSLFIGQSQTGSPTNK
jgi:hypothetical protein